MMLIKLFILSQDIIQIMKWSSFISRVSQELQVQRQRYSRTIYGKIVAFLIYVAAFTCIPQLLNLIIPFLSQYMQLKYVYIAIVLSTLTTVALFFNLSMIFVYKAKIPFFQQYRINPLKPWPWQQNGQKWSQLLWRSVWFNSISIYLVVGLCLLIEIHIDFSIVMNPKQTLSIQKVLLQFFLMMLMQDFIFFTTHYALHQPLLYKFHKIHHEYTTSISPAGLHFHPIEFLFTQSFSNLACMKVALLVGPFNISTFVIWLIFRMWDAYNGHCGYVFSWAPIQLLPFVTNDEFHDFHHTQNSGNYGSHFRFWDSFFGTNKVFRDFKRKQRQKIEKNKAK